MARAIHYMMMITRESIIHKTEHDIKPIMFRAMAHIINYTVSMEMKPI